MHDLVIFDCDGVLVDSEVVSNRVMVRNLAQYGLRLSLNECMSLFVGGTMTGVMKKSRELGADLPEDWIDEIYAEIFEGLKAGVPLVRGIPEVLGYLDENDVPFCVASNGSREKMKITLGQNGLWDRFETAMFSAHEMETGKPEPGLFLAAAGHFGAKAPVVIEDSPSGATAAKRAGMRCLGYAESGDGAKLATLGAEVFHDMADVPALLAL